MRGEVLPKTLVRVLYMEKDGTFKVDEHEFEAAVFALAPFSTAPPPNSD